MTGADGKRGKALNNADDLGRGWTEEERSGELMKELLMISYLLWQHKEGYGA